MSQLQDDRLVSVVPEWSSGCSLTRSLSPLDEGATAASTDALLDPELAAIVEAVTTVAIVAENAANRVSAALQQSLKTLQAELQSAVMQVRTAVTQHGVQLSEQKMRKQEVVATAQILPGLILDDFANANDQLLTKFDVDFDIDAITKEVEDGHHAVPSLPRANLVVDVGVQKEYLGKAVDMSDCSRPAHQTIKLRDDDRMAPKIAESSKKESMISKSVTMVTTITSEDALPGEPQSMRKRKVKSQLLKELKEDDENGRGKGVFIDSSKVKEDVKRSLMQPVYNVTDFYKTTGVPQMICRSTHFEKCVLAVIVLNGLWLGIDTEYNDADVILNAHPVFIIADQFFCIFFTVELLLRYLSFEAKRNCCRDKWFVFDSCLVTVMALESWILNGMLLFSGHDTATSQGILQNTSLLRLLRLLRLFRLARLAKLMRAIPEIMIIVNGLLAAIRTVFFTLVLLVCLVYVFAVAFTTMTKGTDLGDEYFKSVYDSMFTFFVLGAFPDLYEPLQTMVNEGIIYLFAFLIYGILATVSIMNMMIGVLVDVVNATSEVERESMDVEFLRDRLLQELELLRMCDTSDPSKIILDKAQVFEILSSPFATQSLSAVGVDVIAFLELLEYVFTTSSELSFPAFVETALQFRSSKFALVKDIVDLRRYLKYEMEQIVGLLDQYSGQKPFRRSQDTNLALSAVQSSQSQYVPSIAKPLRTLDK